MTKPISIPSVSVKYARDGSSTKESQRLRHASANSESRLGDHVRQFMARDKVHLVAMTGSCFRGDHRYDPKTARLTSAP